MLAVWDLKTRKQKLHAKMDTPGDALAISSDGKILAVGFNNGQLLALDAATYKPIVKRKDRSKAIQVIKFSPDNTICAVGAHDSLIITYDVTRKFKPLKKLKGHHSTITHLDFSMDSAHLMSNCTSYEILFFDATSGKQETGGASQHKDEPWDSWTCTLGWPVQGIFPPCADGSDINACCRSDD